DPKFAACADPLNFDGLVGELQRHVAGETFRQLSRLPSFAWTARGTLSSHLLSHLTFSCHPEADTFRKSLTNSRLGDYGFGQDPIISACDSWSPIGADGGIFGDRDDAEDLTKAGALRDSTGKGVNVI